MAKARKRINAARALRQRPVPAEGVLWKALRNRALAGFKFRRQHPIGRHVVDFACVACRVAIEVDGETHLDRSSADAQRTEFLHDLGWHVLRFWNTEVYDELEAVKEAIYQQCVLRGPPHPYPSPPAGNVPAHRRSLGGGRGE